MADPFLNILDQTNPATVHFAITPDDDNDLARIPRAVFCAADGNLVALDREGTEVTYALTAGMFIPFRPTRILETSTGSFVGWL